MSYKSEYSSDNGWNAIDTNIRLTRSKGQSFMNYLKENDVHTIIRYYASSFRSKTITKEEAEKIAENDFYFLPVYQDTHRKNNHFGYSNGEKAARNALRFVELLDQPEGTTIMFAVDRDIGPSDCRKYVVPFFKGINKVLDGSYRVGTYGPGLACTMLRSEGLSKRSWLTMSRLFRGTKEMFYSGKYAMRQVPPPLKFQGAIHYDKNVMQASPEGIGAFKFGQAAPEKPENDDEDTILQDIGEFLVDLFDIEEKDKKKT